MNPPPLSLSFRGQKKKKLALKFCSLPFHLDSTQCTFFFFFPLASSVALSTAQVCAGLMGGFWLVGFVTEYIQLKQQPVYDDSVDPYHNQQQQQQQEYDHSQAQYA